MITSLTNPQIKALLKLKTRPSRSDTTFLVEGAHLIDEARRAGLLLEVFTSSAKVPGTLVSHDIIKKLSSLITPPGVIGLVKKPAPAQLGSRVLVLDFVQDPANVGALIRSAVAFNWDTVVIKGASPFAPKAIQASQGAIFHINVLETSNLLELITRFKHPIYIAEKRDRSCVYSEVARPKSLMLVLGNEGSGVSAEVSALGTSIYIPINFESLNVAATGAILLSYFGK